MILAAYLINGQPVGTYHKTWLTSDLNDNEAFVFSESLPLGYQDISGVQNINDFGHLTKYDFKKVRDEMKNFIIQLGHGSSLSTETDPSTLSPSLGDGHLIGVGAVGDWTGKDGQYAKWDGAIWVYFTGSGISSPAEEFGFSYLNTVEAKTAATHLIGSIGQQLIAFGYNAGEKEEAQLEYKLQVQECRTLRYEWAENHFLQQIPANTGEVLAVIEADNLHNRYRDHGLDGLAEFGDVTEGLADYIDGSAGTKYAGIGIRQKPWQTLFGQNMSAFSDEIKDKLFYTGIV